MKKIVSLVVIVLLAVAGCKNTNEKKDNPSAPAIAENNKGNDSGGNAILELDLTTLKDEAGFLKAWEDFTTARMADEKKRNEDKSYTGYYLEYLKMYTALLKATTAFSQTIKPAAAAVSFNQKLSVIQNKMYPATK